MSGRGHPDLAARLLRWATTRLAAPRSEWGTAMQGELATIESRWGRLRFTVGCLRAIGGYRLAARELGAVVLIGAGLVAAAVFTGSVDFAPLRWMLLAQAAILAVAAWPGSRRPLRGGLLTGATAGTGAAALWLAASFALPPLPDHAGLPLLLVTLAMAGAGWAGARRRTGTPAVGMFASLYAGTLACLLIFFDVWGLAGRGPAWLIPDLLPSALSPADRLAGSRVEIVDPYVAVPMLGCLLAALLLPALLLLAVRTSRRSQPWPRATRVTPR
jgi:hypothetical protein